MKVAILKMLVFSIAKKFVKGNWVSCKNDRNEFAEFIADYITK